MMFPCVFAASHTARALFFSAGSLLGTFQAGFSLFFGVLDQFFGVRGACFARFWQSGSARARICASWRRQTTNSEANGVTKSIFVPPRELLFGQLFVTSRYFSDLRDFAKIELQLRRELDFESPERHHMPLFLIWTPSQTIQKSRRLMPGGGGGSGCHRSVAQCLSGQTPRYDPKRQAYLPLLEMVLKWTPKPIFQ